MLRAVSISSVVLWSGLFLTSLPEKDQQHPNGGDKRGHRRYHEQNTDQPVPGPVQPVAYPGKETGSGGGYFGNILKRRDKEITAKAPEGADYRWDYQALTGNEATKQHDGAEQQQAADA